MKTASVAVGAVGVLLVLLSVYGRFHGPATVLILGNKHAAASILLFACAVLLVANLLGVLGLYSKK